MQENGLDTIYNYLRISERIGTSGQPTEEHFPAIRDAGFEVVINLLPATRESLPNEREIVIGLGLRYVNIPVVWTEPTLDDLDHFFEAMDAHADRKVFVHCAANMRASAFMYLYRTVQEKTAPEVAAQDMQKIWNPNPIWEAFLRKALAHYGTDR